MDNWNYRSDNKIQKKKHRSDVTDEIAITMRKKAIFSIFV